MKICTKCKQEKEDWEFSNSSKNRDGLQSWCRECYNKNKRENRHNQDLLHNYGITEIQYELILKSQEGKCGICGSDKPSRNDKYFSVDHDHKTFRIRGLLRHKCNTRLTALDDKDWHQKALAYLEKAK